MKSSRPPRKEAAFSLPHNPSMVFAALLLAQGPAPDAVPLESLVPGTTLRVESGSSKRLVLDEGGKTVAVKSPDDLKGHVHVATAPQALEYVRLLRTPGVWPLLFREPVLEIRRQPVLFRVPKALYDDLRVYTVSGWDGVVNDADWARLGLEDPKVTGGSGKDWTVRRPCLLKRGGKYQIGTLVERVSETGKYGFSVERPDDSPRSVKWSITGAKA